MARKRRHDIRRRLRELFAQAMTEAVMMSLPDTQRLRLYESKLFARTMADASIMTLPTDKRERIYESKLIANSPVMLGPYHPYHQPQPAEQNFRKMMRIPDQRQEVSDFYAQSNDFVLEVANLRPSFLLIARNGLYRKLQHRPPQSNDFVVDPTQLRKLTYRCQKYTDEKFPWRQSFLELEVVLTISPLAKRPWRLEWRYYTTVSDETAQGLISQVTLVLESFAKRGDATMIMSPAAIRQVADVLWRCCEEHPWRPIPRVLRRY